MKTSKLHVFLSLMLIFTTFFNCTVFGENNKISALKKTSINKLEDVIKGYIYAQNYFGVAKDRNVIVIQVEALQNFVINRVYEGQEITPNLNELIKKETIYFDSYYSHTARGATSDAEFSALNSIFPASDEASYTKYVNHEIYGLPRILKDRGYSTLAFHGYKPEFWNRKVMYPNLGFDKFISEPNLRKDQVFGWGITDKSFFAQAAKTIAKAKRPTFSFLITLSSHHPYSMPAQYQKIKLGKNEQNTLLGRYLQTINYTDAAIGAFIEELKKNGTYENSVIAIYGDHHAINAYDVNLNKHMTQFLGYKYNVEKMANVPLIIHIPNSEISETNSMVGGHMDFMPTMLNLLGIDSGNIRFYGQDLNNISAGIATTQLVLSKGSFIDDERVFIMASDGIFEHGKAWNRITGEPIHLKECIEGYERIKNAIDECNELMNKNILYQ